MNQDTPIIFSDGTTFFENLEKTYNKHQVGYFILAPSGSGKSHYINHQLTKNWIDGDYLWPSTNADLTNESWVYDENIVHEVNRRSDVITYQAKKLGFWIIGSSNESLKPDAIVLPPWNVHVKYIKNREKYVYDGGAVTEDLEAIRSHRKIMSKWSLKNVPVFKSVEDAANHLAKSS